MLEKEKFLKALIKDLEEKQILFNIDMGINFNLFIVSKNGEFLIPLKPEYCEAEEEGITQDRCCQSCLNHLELAVGLKDVIKAKCYAGFDNLIIPIFIDNDFVGIVGGCIPKKRLKDDAIQKTIYLFKGISGIFEQLGNKEYRVSHVVNELTELSEDILMNYDISSGVNVFFDLDEVFRTILLRSVKITGSRDGWMLLVSDDEKIKRITMTFTDELPSNSVICKALKSITEVSEIEDAKNPILKFLDISNVLAAPIFHVEGVLGILLLLPKDKNYHFTSEMKKYVEILSSQASLAHRNSKIFNQIEENALELVEYVIKDFFEYSTNIRLIEKLNSNVDIKEVLNLLLEDFGFANPEYCFFVRDFDQDRIKQYHLLLKKGETKINQNEILLESELSSQKKLFKTPKKIVRMILNEKEDIICMINCEEYAPYAEAKFTSNKSLLYYIMYSDLIITLVKRDFMGYIFTLMKSFNFRDPYKAGSYERVANLATAVAKELGIAGEDLIHIRLAALFEDIGLVHISEDILNKREKLTKDEYDRVKKHTVLGASILRSVPVLGRIAEIVEACHENYDGTGYPKQLSGENIPLLSRIIFVVSSYISMRTNRAYRFAMTDDEILETIQNDAGKKYDPEVVKAFQKVKQKEIKVK
ncbi:MAG TPA: HD domain-containing protein [Firmicutes bacterium]|nr:HD domain-containing protein [Bacillota bacterium]